MLVSTKTLGGHVDTIEREQRGPRKRLVRSDDFKADAVAAAQKPGVSMAAVALAKGVNANLLRRWVREAQLPTLAAAPARQPWVPERPAFVQLSVPSPASRAGASTRSGAAPGTGPGAGNGADIRLQLQRGPTTVTVTWPVAAAAECAHWMRELLR